LEFWADAEVLVAANTTMNAIALKFIIVLSTGKAERMILQGL
jgi:hypothetical protein